MSRSPYGIPVLDLRAWRLWSGLSQVELGQMAKVDPFTIRKVENGQPASFAVVARLAQALGIDRKRLLHDLPELEKVKA